MSARRPRTVYKQMLDVVRRYAAGFDAASGYHMGHFDRWTPAQKGRLSRYFNEIHRLTYRPHTEYRSTDSKHLKAVQRFAQHPPGFPALKVAFVPGEQKQKIRVTDKGEVISEIVGRGVSKRAIKFDMRRLAIDPEAEARRVRSFNQDIGAFQIQAGQFMIANVYYGDSFVSQLVKYANRYNNPEANNYYGNWMNGLVGYKFHGRPDFEAFIREERRARLDLKEERKKLQRKVRTQREKLKQLRLKAK